MALLVPAAASADPVTIAALGDSLTQGYGLVQEQGFVPQLERWLNARGADVVIVNAGVSGDTTAGGLSRVDWTLTPDVDAMIVALGGNDLLRGLDPAVSRANIDGILDAADAAGVPVLLAGLKAPGNYGADYQAEFDAIFTDLAAQHGTLLAPDFLGAIQSLPDRKAAMADYMQPDGIHPNADGVALIVADLGPLVLDLVETVRAVGGPD
nr:arylesterase [Oceaniovalibus guishaninsula]